MTDSFQKKFLTQQLKSKLNNQHFQSYICTAKSEESVEKKLSVSQPLSPSYLQAMKALQDRIRTLEGENGILNEQINTSSSQKKIKSRTQKKVEKLLSTMTKNEIFKSEVPSQIDQIQDLKRKLAQSQEELTNFEEQLGKIHQDSRFQLNQLESKIRDLTEEINNLIIKLNIQLEANENYKKKITQLNQQLTQSKQQVLNQQLQIENFIKSSKQWNESMNKLSQDNKKYKEQVLEIQQYLDWYTNVYSVDQFTKMEHELQQLKQNKLDLNNQLEEQIKQNSQMTSDYQLMVLKIERMEQQTQNSQELKNKIIELESAINYQKKISQIKQDQQQQTSHRKQQPTSTSEQEQIKIATTDDEITSVIIHKQVSDETISRQVMKLEIQLEELDQKYEQILKQAQFETDLKIKQTLRQELIQILAKIKEVNQLINQLMAQQKIKIKS